MKNNILIKIIEEDALFIIDNLKTKPATGSLIMVTGASGLIGTYLLAVLSHIRKLKLSKFKVIAIVQSPPSKILKSFINKGDKIIRCDLADHNSVKSLPKADLIIHAAGYAQPNKFLKNPIKTILLNTDATFQLIQKLNFLQRSISVHQQPNSL